MELIPFAKCPATVGVTQNELYASCNEELQAGARVIHFHFSSTALPQWGCDVEVECELQSVSSLGPAELEELAAGRRVRAAHPDRPGVTGELALRLGVVRSGQNPGDVSLAKIFVEFVPEAAVPDGFGFREWREIRFPGYSRTLHCVGREISREAVNQAKLRCLYAAWEREMHDIPPLGQDDRFLCGAVMDNYEHLVADILRCQGRIAAELAHAVAVHETALGIAMENRGDFGPGAGFLCGCHRRFRDDDFCEAEPSETWVSRANRIAKMLLEAGAVDHSPIFGACGSGRIAEVRKLLDGGCPPNFSVYGHTTALLEAVSGGNAAVCRLLLERGANPNAPRHFSTSLADGGEVYPLSLAVGNAEICEIVLNAGAKPDLCRDDSNQTPVVFSARYQSTDDARAIFGRVEFEKIVNRLGRTGVHCLDGESLSACREYVPKVLLDRCDDTGISPLVDAIVHGDRLKARVLLELGASPEARGLVWESPFGSSLVTSGDVAVLTPMQAAALANDLDLLKHLMAAGARVRQLVTVVSRNAVLTPQQTSDLRSRIAQDALRVGLQNPLDPTHAPIGRTISAGAGQGGISGFEDALQCVFLDVLRKHPDPAQRYPELVRVEAIRDLASGAGVDQAIIEALAKAALA